MIAQGIMDVDLASLSNEKKVWWTKRGFRRQMTVT